MNDVRMANLEHLSDVGKTFRNTKTFAELLCHERFQITKSNQTAARNSTDRVDMLIRNLTATDEGDAQVTHK